MRLRWPWRLLATVLLAPMAQAADLDAHLTQPGHVLMLRHAIAPGVGDPPQFRLDDCATQRNLDEAGRTQARAIGAWLHARGIKTARVYSSQWCRCLDTARLLDLGVVTPLPALNSFFERARDREPNLRALREFLRAQPRDGGLLVLVTHSVTIQGLSGVSVGSGEGVLLQLVDAEPPRVLGRLRFD